MIDGKKYVVVYLSSNCGTDWSLHETRWGGWNLTKVTPCSSHNKFCRTVLLLKKKNNKNPKKWQQQQSNLWTNVRVLKNKNNANLYLKCYTPDYWMYGAWFPSENRGCYSKLKTRPEISGFAGSVNFSCGMPAIVLGPINVCGDII